MTDWQLAMLCLVPFMWSSNKARTWMVLIAAGMAGNLFWSPAWFMTVDLVAASVVLAHPRGLAQRVIGLLFAAMAVFDIGFLISPQYGEAQYIAAMGVLGWLQWAVLLIWGASDGLRIADRWVRASWRVPRLSARRVR